MKNWVQMRKKTPYRIETAISKAQNVVSHLDLGWHLSSKKHLGAALHKTDWVTVLINYTNYSFTMCFNILQYHTIFTILLSTDTSPPTPIK